MTRRAQVDGAVLERLRALPGVESAAATASPPFGTSFGSNSIEVSGPARRVAPRAAPHRQRGFLRDDADADCCAAEHSSALTPRGRCSVRRHLGQRSTDSLGVAIVSKELENRYFGGNATGQRIRFNRTWLDVIGVVPDVKSRQYIDEASAGVLRLHPADAVHHRQPVRRPRVGRSDPARRRRCARP